MKNKFLEIAGVATEEEFYNMFPSEEAFFQAYPEARQMKKGGNVPTNPQLYSRVKAEAKQKFDTWPSAYGSAWLVKTYKKRGGGYRKGQFGGMMGGINPENPFAAGAMNVMRQNQQNQQGSGDMMAAAMKFAPMLMGMPPMADGGKMPQWLAEKRFKAAGREDQLDDYGYMYGGNPYMMYGGDYMQDGGSIEDMMMAAGRQMAPPVTNSQLYAGMPESAKYNTLYDAVKAFGVTPSFSNRKKLFNDMFGGNYKGTAKQNTELLNMINSGQIDLEAFSEKVPAKKSEIKAKAKAEVKAEKSLEDKMMDAGRSMQSVPTNKEIEAEMPKETKRRKKATAPSSRWYTQDQWDQAMLNDWNYSPEEWDQAVQNDWNYSPEEWDQAVQNDWNYSPEEWDQAVRNDWNYSPEEWDRAAQRNRMQKGGEQTPEMKEYLKLLEFNKKARQAIGTNDKKQLQNLGFDRPYNSNDLAKDFGRLQQLRKAAGLGVSEEASILFPHVGQQMRGTVNSWLGTNFQNGGEPDGEMAMGQLMSIMDKAEKLRQFINGDTDLEPWVSSKLTMADDYIDGVSDYMMYSEDNGRDIEVEEEEDYNMGEMEEMAKGGIPQRYKNKGFTKVGVKRKSTRPGKKWMVLAKKGDKYKVVHGGYKGMKDFSQHGSSKRKDNFWNRMGGKDSAKAKDPFSPLYWHKRFGTWQEGGEIPMIEDMMTMYNPYEIMKQGGMYNMPQMSNFAQNKMYQKQMGGGINMGDTMDLDDMEIQRLMDMGYGVEYID